MGARNSQIPYWIMRIAFALVFAINVQCALSFIVWPEAYLSAYELEGVSGVAAVQGIGVAFLMWNVTYLPVIISPRKYWIVAYIVLIQQAVGLVGESYILWTLPVGHEVLGASIERFVSFDAAGFVLMALAVALAKVKKPFAGSNEKR